MLIVCLALGDRENIAVRVSEPGDAGAAWRAPDAELVLIHSREQLELDALLRELLDGFFGARDMPAENRERRRLEITHVRYVGDPQRDAVRIEDQRERIFAHESQSKC